MSDNKLEAACALTFAKSLREQGTHITTADASQLSIAFHYAAQAVADELRKRNRLCDCHMEHGDSACRVHDPEEE